MLRLSIHVHAAPGPRNSLSNIYVPQRSEEAQQFLLPNISPDLTVGELWVLIDERFKSLYYSKQSEHFQFEIKKLQDEYNNDLDTSYKCGDVFVNGPAPSIVRVTRARLDRECSVPPGSSLRPAFKRSIEPSEFAVKRRRLEDDARYLYSDPDQPLRSSEGDGAEIPATPQNNGTQELIEDSQDGEAPARRKSRKPASRKTNELRSPELGGELVARSLPGDDGFIKPTLPASRMRGRKPDVEKPGASPLGSSFSERAAGELHDSPTFAQRRATPRDIFDAPMDLEPAAGPKEAQEPASQLITPDVSDASFVDVVSDPLTDRASNKTPRNNERLATPLTSDRNLAKLQERRISRGENPDLRKSPGLYLRDGFVEASDQEDDEMIENQKKKKKSVAQKARRKSMPPAKSVAAREQTTKEQAITAQASSPGVRALTERLYQDGSDAEDEVVIGKKPAPAKTKAPTPRGKNLITPEAAKEQYNKHLNSADRANASQYFKEEALLKHQAAAEAEKLHQPQPDTTSKSKATKASKTPKALQTPVDSHKSTGQKAFPSFSEDDQPQNQSDLSFVQAARERSNSFGPPLEPIEAKSSGKTTKTREKTAPPQSSAKSAPSATKSRAKSTAPPNSDNRAEPLPTITPPSMATQRLREAALSGKRPTDLYPPPTIAESSKSGELKRKASDSIANESAAAKKQTQLPFPKTSRKGKEPIRPRVAELKSDSITIPSDSDGEAVVVESKLAKKSQTPVFAKTAPTKSALTKPTKFSAKLPSTSAKALLDRLVSSDEATRNVEPATNTLQIDQDEGSSDESAQKITPSSVRGSKPIHRDRSAEEAEMVLQRDVAASQARPRRISISSGSESSSVDASDHDTELVKSTPGNSTTVRPRTSKAKEATEPKSSPKSPAKAKPATDTWPSQKATSAVRPQPSPTNSTTNTIVSPVQIPTLPKDESVSKTTKATVASKPRNAPIPQKTTQARPVSASGSSEDEETGESSSNDEDEDPDAVARDNARVNEAIAKQGLNRAGAKRMRDTLKMARKMDKKGIAELARQQQQSAVFQTFDRIKRKSFG